VSSGVEDLIRLEGRVAVVTGAASGIGATTAKLLAAAGATVCIADVNVDGAELVAKEIVADGGEAVGLPVDIGDETATIALVDAVREQFGRLDILDNNAALVGPFMARDIDLLDLDVEVWDRTFSVDARGTMLMVKHALPLMISSGGGSIINIAAGAATWGDARSTSYGSAKAAVASLTRYIAVQHLRDGIRCNALAPGVIYTQHNTATVSDALSIEVDARQLRRGEPLDIARVVLFLASDMSSFMTGQLLRVDGGLSAGSPYFPIRDAQLRQSKTQHPS
jgi:NAD(P)-dependent dehydrogenase (short-subunit alcohol dehydrogenase family)